MEFEISEQNFEKVKVLGQGTYGKCYLVMDKIRSELCVLKQVQIMGMSEQEISQAVRQATILQSLNHSCIVRFIGQFRTKDAGHLNIIMSYADGGDLSQRIKEMKSKKEIFSQNQILQYFSQVCLALQHVHERKIIHRDIKSQNVFLTKEGNVKLGDFGISRPLQLTLQKIKSVVGTPYYMSPQICDNKEYSLKTDIWSLGVLLLQMCHLKPPFEANSLPSLALKISKGEYLPAPKLYSKEFKKLVTQMLQIDPVRRPSIHQVLNSPLLRDRIKMFKYRDNSQNDNSSLLELSMGNKKSSGASRGLFIDSGVDDFSSLEHIISPKSQAGSKNHDMPVKKVDNFTKDSSKNDKKMGKRGDQLRRREVSQPNLTPKGHSRIDNDRKVMVKNNSQLNFEKKKSVNPTPVCFKKKAKHPDIAKSLQEINECKNDIYELQGQISHRDKEPIAMPVSVLEINDLITNDEVEQDDEQTPLETLEDLLRQITGHTDLSSLYKTCEQNGGICDGLGAGLATFAFGLMMKSN